MSKTLSTLLVVFFASIYLLLPNNSPYVYGGCTANARYPVINMGTSEAGPGNCGGASFSDVTGIQWSHPTLGYICGFSLYGYVTMNYFCVAGVDTYCRTVWCEEVWSGNGPLTNEYWSGGVQCDKESDYGNIKFSSGLCFCGNPFEHWYLSHDTALCDDA